MNLIDEILSEATTQEQERVRDLMKLAARIADALAAKGWNQKQLAIEMGKSPSEISKWLSGTHNFTVSTLCDLSRVLEVKLLCLEEELPVTVRTVIRYHVVHSVGKQLSSVSPVLWNQFHESMGQTYPNA